MLARRTLLALSTLLAFQSATAAEGQAPAAPAAAPGPSTVTAPAPAPTAVQAISAAPDGRVVAGHTFMPSASVAGALVTTSFASGLVLGYGTTSGSFQIGDRVFDRTFDYAGIGATLGYEYAFLPWLSARFGLMEAMYSGIDGPSAIVVGTTLQTAFDLGATASLPVGDTLRLGFLFDAGVAPGLALTIGNGIQAVIDSCNAGDCNLGNSEDVFKLNNVRTYKPAIAANWVPWRPLGVTANLAYVYATQKQNDGTFTGHAYELAVAADLDLRELWRVPIGLQLTYAWTSEVSGTDLQSVADLGGGLFYTGRKELALGFQFFVRRFRVQPELDLTWSTVVTNLGLRYYF
jgi:hypothetical protein